MIDHIQIKKLTFALIVSLASACATPKPTPTATPGPTASAIPTATATATPTPTPTLTPTPTSTLTPTASATPTPTPTPTPTAPPATVSGSPRQVLLSAPVPQSGAPCGLVDTLDFPIDPPNADKVTVGGRDFGVYRARYEGYHAGEDWRGPSGQSTLGTPVHSIGHGTVTYAAPLGWGADQGVLIVRHVFPDGSTILSFYGHLDPPSVVLKAGDCVARGDQVGQIGRPRTSPHLHFEIRNHTPLAPGPGYWSTDPTLAGWEPPSQYIWNYRIASSPGVLWTHPFSTQRTQGLGLLGRDTFVAIEDDQLLGTSVLDGSLHWSHPISLTVTSAILDANRSAIYAADILGRVKAFQSAEFQDGETLTSTWEIKLDAIGYVTLMPLPGGGLVASFREQMFGLSSVGEVLWQRDSIARAFDWVFFEDRLVFSTLGQNNSIWMVDESGPVTWNTPASGHLAVADGHIWIYGQDGVYRLNPKTHSTDLLYALPTALLRWSDMVTLPDGGLLLAHSDAHDRRLIALNADGSLRWERSYADVAQGYQQHLLVLDGYPYFVSQYSAASAHEISIFAIDLSSAKLTQIFTAGSRNPIPENTRVFAAGEGRILINVEGVGLTALDPQAAFEVVLQASAQP